MSGVLLISGDTGSGKTSLITTGAEWMWKNHKKITRLYTCDGGGYGTRTQALVNLGIIQVWRMRTRAKGIAEGMVEETCMRASQGWWPKVIDPLTGDTPEGVELIPPIQQMHTMLCPAGHEVVKKPARSQLALTVCSCGAKVAPDKATIMTETTQTPGFEDVGMVVIEGLTSMSDWILMSLADRTGRLELGGEKPALGGVIRSGGMQFGSNNRSHYGFAQTQAEKWLLNSTAIPNLILPPIWTSLESRVDDSSGISLPYYGPSIAGQAKTGKVPQWVGNYIGCQVAMDSSGKKKWQLWLSEYMGTDNVPHRYKVRVDPGILPEYLEDTEGKPFSKFNLGLFFELLDKGVAESERRATQEFPDAPGVKGMTAPKGIPLGTPAAKKPALPTAGVKK